MSKWLWKVTGWESYKTETLGQPIQQCRNPKEDFPCRKIPSLLSSFIDTFVDISVSGIPKTLTTFILILCKLNTLLPPTSVQREAWLFFFTEFKWARIMALFQNCIFAKYVVKYHICQTNRILSNKNSKYRIFDNFPTLFS